MLTTPIFQPDQSDQSDQSLRSPQLRQYRPCLPSDLVSPWWWNRTMDIPAVSEAFSLARREGLHVLDPGCTCNHNMAKSKTFPAPNIKKPVNGYGIPNLRPGLNQFQIDLIAFAHNLPFERTGQTRLQLYRKISDALIPKYHEWHDWTTRQIEAFCNNRWVALSGCSNSAKTHNTAGYSVVWWMCAPEASSVIYCSTTVKALRRRAWANIQSCRQTLVGNGIDFGNFVDSRMVWQCVTTKNGNEFKDDKHAIIGIAVEEGSTVKVADGIKGHHTRRQMVVIDEATAVPEAIYDAASNLWSYPAGMKGGEFVMIAIGNPRSKLDNFGKFIEPNDGWSSVSVDTEEWETRPQLDNRKGVVVRFDALKSPNIIKATKISNHLPTQEMVNAAVKKEGSDSDPKFWSNMRGFMPPEGIRSTVFTDTFLRVNEAFGRFLFTGESFLIGGFDPAFSSGGDHAVLQPARVGKVVGGNFGIQLLPRVIINLDAKSSNPMSYQLAEKVRQYCEQIGLEPKNLCMDCTGEGGAIGDIIYRTWSREIMRTEFQWRASENPVSHEDNRLSVDVYKNKRTELWFQAKEYTAAGQIRGIDNDLASELIECNYEPESGSSKRVLEPKIEMKARIGKSPDYADAFVVMAEAARRRGIRIAPIGITKTVIEKASEDDQSEAAIIRSLHHSTESDNIDFEEQNELQLA